MKKVLVIVLLLGMMGTPVAWAANKIPQPGPRDKCPVCGMFVFKYPDFLAVIGFADGSIVFFDGVKDMFKYYLDIRKYNPQRSRSDIDFIYVNDYYSVTHVNGRKAFYVQGSDVYGPMGNELIPFAKELEAREFMKDHKGKKLLRFQDVNSASLRGLD